MTTAITLGLGGLGGGAALAAAGLATAGAVGLGLAAAGAFRRGGRRRGGRRGGRRHGRDVEEESESEVLQRVLSLIRQQDVTGCGMRLVCELAGIAEEDLDEEQMAILNLVEPRIKPGEGVLPPGGFGDYKIAKTMGQTHENCSTSFPLCSLNGNQLMEVVNSYVL